MSTLFAFILLLGILIFVNDDRPILRLRPELQKRYSMEGFKARFRGRAHVLPCT